MTIQIKKSGRKTYLNEDEELFVVVSDNIEGRHGLPLDYLSFTQPLKNVTKAMKSKCGDYNIKDKSSIRYLWEVIKRVNKK